jgi:hypothetical protein
LGYEQTKNSCGAHSLTLVKYLVSGATAVPTDTQWVSDIEGTGKVYDQVQFAAAPATSSTQALKANEQFEATVLGDLVKNQYCDPRKIVGLFKVTKWAAEMCVESNALTTVQQGYATYLKSPTTALKPVAQLGAMIAILNPTALRKCDVVDIVAKAAVGKQYASIVTQVPGGLHYVTLRKGTSTNLEVHDSNSSSFDSWTTVASKDLTPLTGSFSTDKTTMTFTGFAVLYTGT